MLVPAYCSIGLDCLNNLHFSLSNVQFSFLWRLKWNDGHGHGNQDIGKLFIRLDSNKSNEAFNLENL